MQIRIPSRNCRAAVGAAILALEGKLAEDRAAVSERSYNALHDGAVHNGLDVNEARKKEMREMVDRDVAHMMEQHPGQQTLEMLNNFRDMLAYHQGDDIVIDDQDFHLLKPHLSGAFTAPSTTAVSGTTGL